MVNQGMRDGDGDGGEKIWGGEEREGLHSARLAEHLPGLEMGLIGYIALE